MSEQSNLLSSDYWMSRITLAPIPELPERAVVATLFGNGRPVALRYEPSLPRLSGLASIDARRSYEALLNRARLLVESGDATNESIGYLLGPQFTVEPPRPLARTLTDEIIETLSRASLKSPPAPPREAVGETVVRFARNRLMDAIGETQINESQVSRQKKPQDFYPSISRIAPHGLPRAGAVIRGNAGRDLWLDAVSFSSEFDYKQVGDHAGRVNFLFYTMRGQLRDLVRQREQRTFKLIALVDRIDAASPEDLKQVRRFVLHQFNQYADRVIDAEQEDKVAALARLGEWAGALRRSD